MRVLHRWEPSPEGQVRSQAGARGKSPALSSWPLLYLAPRGKAGNARLVCWLVFSLSSCLLAFDGVINLLLESISTTS